MPDFLADSYAFIAALDGSKAYRDLLSNATVVTTGPNLQEVAYAVRRAGGDAAGLLAPLLPLCIQPEARVALAAATFRAQRIQAGANCSTVDAWSYASAQALGIPFLTGDEGFRGVPGVQFLKA